MFRLFTHLGCVGPGTPGTWDKVNRTPWGASLTPGCSSFSSFLGRSCFH